MTAFDLAMFMYITSIGKNEEEAIKEVVSAGVAIQQELDKVKKDNPEFSEGDFFLDQREDFIAGLEKIQSLFKYVNKEK